MKKVFAVILLAASLYSAMAQTNNTHSSQKKRKITTAMGDKAPLFSLAGTWTLKAAEVILPDGTHITDPGLGKDAKGILMVDADGQYSLQIFRPDRPKFVSGDKKRGTPEEYESALLGLSTHVGHIKIDTANKLLQFDIDYAAFPNWNRTTQIRQFTLKGDELYYQLPATAGAGTIAASIWTRVKFK
ncbi:lipocalin-like domain-containing protein [Mucilaginibacter sp.]|uniref:lipocalin-like domain-containing protein n=1 Tax=Mucilaginibacter sp. TaxID=1882438 RepID=UPI0032654736